MKKIPRMRDCLRQLPENMFIAVVTNMNRQRCIDRMDLKMEEDEALPSIALADAFYWDRSREGKTFWENYHLSLVNQGL